MMIRWLRLPMLYDYQFPLFYFLSIFFPECLFQQAWLQPPNALSGFFSILGVKTGCMSMNGQNILLMVGLFLAKLRLSLYLFSIDMTRVCVLFNMRDNFCLHVYYYGHLCMSVNAYDVCMFLFCI